MSLISDDKGSFQLILSFQGPLQEKLSSNSNKNTEFKSVKKPC